MTTQSLTFGDYQQIAAQPGYRDVALPPLTAKPHAPRPQRERHGDSALPAIRWLDADGPQSHLQKNRVVHESLNKTWDANWSNGQTKAQYSLQSDDLLMPAKSQPTLDRLPVAMQDDPEAELRWLIETQDLELATTLDIFRENRIEAHDIASSSFAGAEDPGDDDMAHDLAEREHGDTIIYERPSPLVVRRIEMERWGALNSKVVRFYPAREPGRVLYWVTTGKTDANGKPIATRIDWNASPKMAAEWDRIQRTVLSLGITYEERALRRHEARGRYEMYGRDWLWSYLTPEEFPLAKAALATLDEVFADTDPLRERLIEADLDLHRPHGDELTAWVTRFHAETSPNGVTRRVAQQHLVHLGYGVDRTEVYEGIQMQEPWVGEHVFDQQTKRWSFQPFPQYALALAAQSDRIASPEEVEIPRTLDQIHIGHAA